MLASPLRPAARRPAARRLAALVAALLVCPVALLAGGPALAAGATASLSVTITPATTPIPSGATAQWTVNYQCSSVDPSVTSCANAQIAIAVAKRSPQDNAVTCTVGGSTGNGDFAPTANGFAGTGTGSSIPVGASGQLTFACKTANGTTPDQSTLTATATFSSSSAAAPATATAAPITITAKPAMSVTKVLLGASVLDGVTAYQLTGDYTKFVPGNGFWDTSNPVLVDTLPAGAVFVAASSGGVYNAAANTITWPSSAAADNCCGPDISVTVQVRYPSSTFGPTNTVTNTATFTATTVTDPSTVSATASVSHTFANNPVSSGAFSKTVVPNSTSAGAIFKTANFHWNLQIANTGNVPIGGTLYDYAPCGSAPLNNSVPQSCTTPGFTASEFENVPQGSVFTFYLADGTTQTVTKSTDGSVPYPVPAGWLIGGYAIALPPGAVNPSSTLIINVDGKLTAGDAYTPTTQTNCAQWSLTNAPPTTLTNIGDTDKSCAVAYFEDAAADVIIAKSYTGGPNALVSGQIAPWRLLVSNKGAAGDAHYLDVPVHVTDTLPAGVSYVPGSAVVTSTAGGLAYAAAFTTADMTVSQSGQTLTFTFPPGSVLNRQQAFTIQLDTVVNPGVGASTQTNTASVWDDADPAWAPSPNTGTTSTASFATGTSAQAGAQKEVEGQYDSRFLFSVPGAPAIGTSPAGGTSQWRLNIGSLGSTPITGLVVYDVFPSVGDTGVSGGQSGVARGSQFQPTLARALTLPTGVTATYSLSANPCRPEVYPNQPAGCGPTWLTAAQVTDWTQVRAVRIDATALTFQPGQTVEVDYAMKLPASAAPGQVAWNSLAYAASSPSGPLLPAEPVKVGIRVATPPSVAIVKTDAAGNHAPTAATAVTLDATKTTGLTFAVTNTGGEPLQNVTVSDAIVAGSATVAGLSCAFPDGSTGTQWSGPLAVGASVHCTATLGALGFDAVHADAAKVAATGALSGTPVSAVDQYHARTPDAPAIVLPLTGGVGTDVVAVAAIAAFTVAAALAAWQLRRRLRRLPR
ncbi:isopeptide-forming domain-containing fimbrial protein [Leifsonia shinshuensis]|uniref:Isopeptide-forming domain-containing fimbrial protein n=1 Tax=Leifsonia shinshuensis TaxID=150026 RepID=A0A7G6YDF0_9MICO|nr:isopeptide-forming domain-containing fimbrial protein [Leifsonia shinshuensis]QNE36515.1 isopeptide-forming domain-containing fimbrial protein [Leifsonia shinshuensis]